MARYKKEDVFPIEIPCPYYEGGGEYRFQDIWLEHRPKEKTWFGYDVIIHDSKTVELIGYEPGRRYCDHYRGDEFFRKTVGVAASLTKPFIEARLRRLAEERLAEEERIQRETVINQYMYEIRQDIKGATKCS